MWHVLHLIARPIEVLLGVFCVVTAIMLYPNEEGKIQSKLEDFWIRVDDFKNLALSHHAAFMTQVAKLEMKLLDKLFGRKLVSIQSVVLSCCLSLTSIHVSGMILNLRIGWGIKNTLSLPWVKWVVPPVLIAVCYLLFGSRLVRSLLVACVIVLIATTPIYFSHSAWTHNERQEVVLTLVEGFVFDVVFIVITRQFLRWASATTHSALVLAIIALDLLLAVFLAGPALSYLMHFHTELPLVGPSLSNLLDATMALLFVFLACLLLVHRAVWPLLSRTLFRMTDIGTKGRRAILTAVGVALLSASVFGGKFPELFKDLVKILGG
jgi:hypothetical protein